MSTHTYLRSLRSVLGTFCFHPFSRWLSGVPGILENWGGGFTRRSDWVHLFSDKLQTPRVLLRKYAPKCPVPGTSSYTSALVQNILLDMKTTPLHQFIEVRNTSYKYPLNYSVTNTFFIFPSKAICTGFRVSTPEPPEAGEEQRNFCNIFFQNMCFLHLEHQNPPSSHVWGRSELFDDRWKAVRSLSGSLVHTVTLEIRRRQSPASPKYHGLGHDSIP